MVILFLLILTKFEKIKNLWYNILYKIFKIPNKKFENLKKILYNIYIINELLKLNNNLIMVIVQLSADLTP